MSTDLTRDIDNAAWESKTDLIRRTVAAGASADELEIFFHQARRAGLDPLNKEIYFVKRQGKGVVQVGIDGFRKIAHRTGACAGSDDAEFIGTTERGFPAAAKVTVWKMVQGQRCPFSATARWEEYFPGDQQGFQWKRMPHAMLSKCAESLALRKAFPMELAGLYTHEEMEQAGTSETPVQEPQGTKARPTTDAPSTTAAADGTVESASEDKGAFGYVPSKRPHNLAFSEPRTEAQRGKAHAAWKERGLADDVYGATRKAVLNAFGFDAYDKKGHMMLWIDFILSSTPEQMNAAIAAAYKGSGQTAMEMN